jgi:hypothetical protein
MRMMICLALRPASISNVVHPVDTMAQLPELPLPRTVSRTMPLFYRQESSGQDCFEAMPFLSESKHSPESVAANFGQFYLSVLRTF